MTHRMVYIAAPLFSASERSFNLEIRDILRLAFKTYVPQEDGVLLVEAVKPNSPPEKLEAVRKMIFITDLSAIRSADLFFIILDGRCVDEGAAFELGYAFALGKPCLGLQTDPRRLLPLGNNPMIAESLEKIFLSVDELRHWVRSQMNRPTKGSRSDISH